MHANKESSVSSIGANFIVLYLRTNDVLVNV